MIPLDSGVAQGVKWGKRRPTLLRWQLLSKDMRSNVWGPKRLAPKRYLTTYNPYPIGFGKGGQPDFTWRNVVNIKAKIVFPAGTKNVFKNAVNFGAPAASILQRRLQDAVLCVDVHSWRGKVFLKWKQRIQQSLGLEDVDIPRIVQPVIPGLKTVSAQAQSSAPSRLWSIGIYRNGRMMLNSPLEAILPVVKKPPVFDLSSKISL